jgi:hypothetical protein
MMSQGAQVGSIAAIEAFQAALAKYIDESQQALVMIDLEIRRAVDWVRVDRAEYWKHEIRRSTEAVNRAKDELHRCISFKSMENYTPACVDERKALQRAQQRLQHAEQKAEAVRKWSRAMQHELNEYAGRIVQFNAGLEGDIPKAMATLGRILATLDRYMTTTAPRPLSESAIARPGALHEPEATVSESSMARPVDQPDPSAAVESAAEENAAARDSASPAALAAEADHAAGNSEARA